MADLYQELAAVYAQLQERGGKPAPVPVPKQTQVEVAKVVEIATIDGIKQARVQREGQTTSTRYIPISSSVASTVTLEARVSLVKLNGSLNTSYIGTVV